jgi:transcriptional regulator with XRE-family HTH domain
MDVSELVLRHIELIQSNVRRLRGAMSQKEFARTTGVSLTTIQRIESGCNFEIISLFKIAEALHIHPYELCMDEKEKRALEGQVQTYRDVLKKELKDEIIKELKKEIAKGG